MAFTTCARLRAALTLRIFSVCLALHFARVPSAHAFDPFEIQVYDGSAEEPGEAALELHTNYHHAPRQHLQQLGTPELPPHQQLHFTFEPALGLTPFWEIGAYVQVTERFGDGPYWSGAKLRSKFVVPESWHPHLRLGLNFELAAIPQRFDADRLGGEIRPIAAWAARYVHLAVNPNVEVSLAGPGFAGGPSLNPAVAAYARIPDVVELGVEYYASLGPIAGLLPVAQQEHYVFGAGNILAFAGWELNLGVGAGLTAASTDLIVKAIFGHAIGRLWGPSPQPPRSH